MEIIPAIMPKSFDDMRQKMAQVVDHVRTVQLDLMDGIFVQEKTFPFYKSDMEILDRIINGEEGLPYWDKLDIELDLMVTNAHNDFDTYIALGAKRIIFHMEAEVENFQKFLENIDPYVKGNIEIGIAISNDTPIENIFTLIPHVSFVQCMGIARIGYQGEGFDERVIERIKILREKFPDLLISVDGSVNENTIAYLKDAGANRFVVGSALFNSLEPSEAIKTLESIVF